MFLCSPWILRVLFVQAGSFSFPRVSRCITGIYSCTLGSGSWSTLCSKKANHFSFTAFELQTGLKGWTHLACYHFLSTLIYHDIRNKSKCTEAVCHYTEHHEKYHSIHLENCILRLKLFYIEINHSFELNTTIKDSPAS